MDGHPPRPPRTRHITLNQHHLLLRNAEARLADLSESRTRAASPKRRQLGAGPASAPTSWAASGSRARVPRWQEEVPGGQPGRGASRRDGPPCSGMTKATWASKWGGGGIVRSLTRSSMRRGARQSNPDAQGAHILGPALGEQRQSPQAALRLSRHPQIQAELIAL